MNTAETASRSTRGNSGEGLAFTAGQIDHARKLIDAGERREDEAALLNVDRTIVYFEYS